MYCKRKDKDRNWLKFCVISAWLYPNCILIDFNPLNCFHYCGSLKGFEDKDFAFMFAYYGSILWELCDLCHRAHDRPVSRHVTSETHGARLSASHRQLSQENNKSVTKRFYHLIKMFHRNLRLCVSNNVEHNSDSLNNITLNFSI